MSKEIEKPFRCNVCTLSFTNEDHLQVHKKRHEMSLNLSKGNGGTSNTTENYVDETPTPTRFFKNCEEVGLFQDLQNVNPFDEQFVKAASATPSTDAEFDFNFTFRRTSSHAIEATGTTEGVVTTDSLNTPQVFGFQPTTPLISQRTTTSNQKDTGGATEADHSLQKPTNEQSSVRLNKHVLDLSINKSGHGLKSSEITLKASAKRMILATKNKSNLRLNLSGQGTDETKRNTINPSQSPDQAESSAEDCKTDKRTGLLERNRAAASRSRERRKRYISALEAKCATLQAKLNELQTDLITTKTENVQLREELNLHNTCNVSLKRLEDMALNSSVVKNAIIVTSPMTCDNKPSLAPRPQNSSSIPSMVPVSFDVTSTFNAVASTPVKRGRPKRGFEKRVSDLSFIPVNSSSREPSTKIQILPISAYKKSLSAGANIILLNPETGS